MWNTSFEEFILSILVSMNIYKLIFLISGIIAISCISCAHIDKYVSHKDTLIREKKAELESKFKYEIIGEFEIADTFANSNLKIRVESVKKCPFNIGKWYMHKETTKRELGKHGGTVLAINWLLGLSGAYGSYYLFSLAPKLSNETPLDENGDKKVDEYGDEEWSDREEAYVLGSLVLAVGIPFLATAIIDSFRTIDTSKKFERYEDEYIDNECGRVPIIDAPVSISFNNTLKVIGNTNTKGELVINLGKLGEEARRTEKEWGSVTAKDKSQIINLPDKLLSILLDEIDEESARAREKEEKELARKEAEEEKRKERLKEIKRKKELKSLNTIGLNKNQISRLLKQKCTTLDANIIQNLGNKEYEIAYVAGFRLGNCIKYNGNYGCAQHQTIPTYINAILKTVQAEYTSSGRIGHLAVKKLGQRKVTLTNGFEETWDVWIEYPFCEGLKLD